MEIRKIDPAETLAIRQKVLWPDKPIEFCILEDDPHGIHYGGFIQNRLITVASIFITGKTARLRKFATIKEFQGRGYGTKIIEEIISDLIKKEIIQFWCDARLSAENFYNRFLMKRDGETFFKSSLEYIKMKRDL